MRPYIFITVVLLILGTVNFYLYKRLLGACAVPVFWRWTARAFFVIATLSTPAPFFLSHYASPTVARMAAWPVFLWTGLMFILLTLTFSVDIVRILVWLGRLVSGAGSVDPVRALAINRMLAIGITALAFVAGSGAIWNAFRIPAVKRVTVEIAGLPADFDGFTIAQLTDLHIGLFLGGDWLEEVVAATNDLSPDLVAITGDLVDVPFATAHYRMQLMPLMDLKTRHGPFFITGNHEYYGDTGAWLDLLASLGLTILNNRRVTLTEGSGQIEIAGVFDPTDPHSEGAVARALEGREPNRPVVLFAHQPKVIQEAADQGVALMLSGHTHGGQIWPFRYFVKLQTPHVAGLYDHEGTQLYVSQGTGFWGPPMRLFTRSEITLITLRAR